MLRRTKLVTDNVELLTMDTTLEIATSLCITPAKPAAVPVNLPIAQPVESHTVSLTPPRSPKPREVFIQGLTKSGKQFRPSDWAERLAGAMSSFRPGASHMGRAAHIGYSPYCVPTSIGDVKCVIVNEALRDLEPMAWDFVMNFARDNDLQVTDACSLP